MNTISKCLMFVAIVVSGCAADAVATGDPRLNLVLQSRDAWLGLEAAMGNTYWYEDENCVFNASTHTVTAVQVEAGTAQGTTTRSIETSECSAGRVNRYQDAEALTMLELHDACDALIRRVGDAVAIEVDDAGVIVRCSYEGDAGCQDNCGEGYLLRSWAFGTAP